MMLRLHFKPATKRAEQESTLGSNRSKTVGNKREAHGAADCGRIPRSDHRCNLVGGGRRNASPEACT
jgi:hypothetical protein